MAVYINGLGNISAQPTWHEDYFFEEIIEAANRFQCSEPNYKDHIRAILLRRMAKIVKMGVASAQMAINESNIPEPDAIITGTALGCLEDTEKFLTDLLKNNEQLLTPTSFIKSTHNTISGQIALLNKCNSYNFTYTHRGFSFETSLMDAIMQMEEGMAKTALVGGVDEVTDNYYYTSRKVGFWKQEDVQSKNLFDLDSPGSLPGEGSIFFALSDQKSDTSYASILDADIKFKPPSGIEVQNWYKEFLSAHSLSNEDIDAFVLGYSGDNRYDHFYNSFSDTNNDGKHEIVFKHLSGEYQCASAFAMWTAAKVIKKGFVPQVLQRRSSDRPLNKVIIYNHFMGDNHSLLLLERC